MIHRLLHRIQAYKILICFGCISLVIYSLLGLVIPAGIRVIIDSALPTKDASLLWMVLLSLTMCYVLRVILGYVSKYLIHYCCQRVLFDIRKDLVVHLQNLSMDYFDSVKSGKLVARVINDVSKVQALLNQGLNNVVVCSLSLYMTPKWSIPLKLSDPHQTLLT